MTWAPGVLSVIGGGGEGEGMVISAKANIPVDDPLNPVTNDTFVSVSPSKYDSSIDNEGLLLSHSQEDPSRIWLTKWEDVQGVNNAEDFETKLYNQSLWDEKSGSFESGATVRSVDTSQLNGEPTAAGVTNTVNGVRQWYYSTGDIPPSALRIIQRMQ
jgi:hypothetical protein